VIKEEKGIITMSRLDSRRANMEATLLPCNVKFRYVVCVIWLMMDLRNEPGFLRREFAGSELLLGMHASWRSKSKRITMEAEPLACNMQSSKAKRLYDQTYIPRLDTYQGPSASDQEGSPGPGLGVQHRGGARRTAYAAAFRCVTIKQINGR